MAGPADGSWNGWRWTVVRERDAGGEEYLGVELEHPDGRRRGCGFGGPVVPPGEELNSYVGWSDDGPVVLLARTLHPAELVLEVDGVPVPPVWAGEADGARYLLHLRDPAEPGEAVVTVRG